MEASLSSGGKLFVWHLQARLGGQLLRELLSQGSGAEDESEDEKGDTLGQLPVFQRPCRVTPATSQVEIKPKVADAMCTLCLGTVSFFIF